MSSIEVKEDHSRRYLVDIFPFDNRELLKISIDWGRGPSGSMTLNAVRVSGSHKQLASALGMNATSSGMRALADGLIAAADAAEFGRDKRDTSEDFDRGRNAGRLEAVSMVTTFLNLAQDDAKRELGTDRGQAIELVVAQLRQLKDQLSGG